MLRKTFFRLKKPKSDQSSPVSSQEIAGSSSLSEIAKMLSASGRIGLVSLRKIAEEKDKEIFVKLVQDPVLAGSAIQAGRISNQDGGGDEMNRTQIFEPSLTNPGASAASVHCGMPFIRWLKANILPPRVVPLPSGVSMVTI